ncbi:MAG: methionyl-tRNA formyltransferase [Desulfobacteraceae bacterium]|nr:methionyl-tRNA formyltransferase [Desulfobacteraceae bacterium]MCF8094893.1 methionyl-tRNA formyltransferase [Desulfobacteraceae bacterium]
MTQLNLIFMGTPDFAVPSLKALHQSGHRVKLVVTQPDRPKGRGRQLAGPPVKQAAKELGYKVIQPQSVKNESFFETLRDIQPDLLVVTAFGHILPKRLLELPPMGAVNLHASLLPKYRGPAPIQWAIINGESETGVTAMLMDAGLDTGEILLSRKTPIYADDTAGALHDRLSQLSADVLDDTLDAFCKGTVKPVSQDHASASYAPMLKKSDGRLDWSGTAEYLERFIRGMYPWPGAYTYWNNTRLNIYKAEVRPGDKGYKPGTVIEAFDNELRVAAGKDAISIKEIQAESGRRMDIAEFLKGSPVAPGTVLK